MDSGENDPQAGLEPVAVGSRNFLWGLVALCAAAFGVLWSFFGGACDGSILCGVAPAYFLVFTMFLFAGIELAVTAVWTLLKLTGAPTPSH